MADDLRFDVRLVERMLGSGALSREEYRKYLDALPDLSSQVVVADPAAEANGGPAPGTAPTARPAKKREKK